MPKKVRDKIMKFPPAPSLYDTIRQKSLTWTRKLNILLSFWNVLRRKLHPVIILVGSPGTLIETNALLLSHATATVGIS